jgi:hypothetical protein
LRISVRLIYITLVFINQIFYVTKIIFICTKRSFQATIFFEKISYYKIIVFCWIFLSILLPKKKESYNARSLSFLNSYNYSNAMDDSIIRQTIRLRYFHYDPIKFFQCLSFSLKFVVFSFVGITRLEHKLCKSILKREATRRHWQTSM